MLQAGKIGKFRETIHRYRDCTPYGWNEFSFSSADIGRNDS